MTIWFTTKRSRT